MYLSKVWRLLVCALLSSVVWVPLSALGSESVLRVGVHGGYPPFSEVKDNRLIGFDIDIAKALCKEMKKTCEFVRTDRNHLIPNLNDNKYDVIIASMNATPERLQQVHFTHDYYQDPACFVRKKGSGLTLSKLALREKKIGVLNGSSFDSYATQKMHVFDIEVKRYKDQSEVFTALLKGDVDFILASGVAIDVFLETPKGQNYERFARCVTNPKYFGSGIGIAVRLEESALAHQIDEAVRAIRKNGEYQKISMKYFNRDIYFIN